MGCGVEAILRLGGWVEGVMSISKLASTVILATSFATIFLFAFIFYLYGGERSALEDALSMTASFFGGIATLVAAYVATQLFNDWRVVKQYEIKLDYVLTIKKQTKELISFINSNRRNFVKYKFEIKSPNLTMQDFNVLLNEIHEIESEVVLRLNLISIEMNELYFLKTKNPQDPMAVELAEKIKYFGEIGVNKDNYHNVWEKRLTTLVFDEYFQYLTDDLTSFVYDNIMTRYLDDLIPDVNYPPT